jgi:Phage tail protein
MADQLYMTINEDWLVDDNLNDYAATGWSIGTGGNVTQEAGYVKITASSGTDALIKFTPEKTLPYSFDMVVATTSANQAFRMDDGIQRMWVNFPNTNGIPKYYRLIVRIFGNRPGAIALYENGKLIKEKPDLLESTTFNSIYYYNSGGSTSGEIMEVHHHRHAWGVDWGAPTSSRMTDTIYLDNRDGYKLLFNRSGAEMPPMEIIEDELSFEAGSIHRLTNIQSRPISLGIMVSATSKSELNEKKRKLFSVLGAGSVKLYAKMSDGYRFLTCRYTGGMEGAENRDVAGPTFQKYVVSLRAFYPFWQKAVKTIEEDIIPIDGILSMTMSINNASSVEDCYPEFFLTGPCNNPTVENQTTGKKFSLNVALPTSSDYIYVNTRPGERTIKFNGAISWDKLSTGSNQLWSLVPGQNIVKISYSGGTTTTTYSLVSFREVHWGT